LYPRCLPIAPLLLALLLLLLLPNIMRKSEKELERGRGASNDELCPGYF
jgi:competence protein ComGC